MDDRSNILTLVTNAAAKKMLFLPHAVRQMSHPDRMISPGEIRQIIADGVLVEDYPEDVRGHSCLILGHGKEWRPVHVVCSPKQDFLTIITAYLPNPKQWDDNFTKRKST